MIQVTIYVGLQIDTSLGIASLLIPEVGVGMLILGGAEVLMNVNESFWLTPTGRNIQINIYNGIFDMTNPYNYGIPNFFPK